MAGMESPSDVSAGLLATVDDAAAKLASVPDSVAARVPAPGSWSALQVLGHLIDSAANNHRRFVSARSQDDLVFDGYDQDRWVEAQDYEHARWSELLVLWSAYNRHLARVMAATPRDVQLREHRRHNLHDLAWQPVVEGAPVTLQWFFADYLGHLRHHLRQIGDLVGRRVG